MTARDDFDAITDKRNHQESLLEREALREMEDGEYVFNRWLSDRWADDMCTLFCAVAQPNDGTRDAARRLIDMIEGDWLEYRVNSFDSGDAYDLFEKDQREAEQADAEGDWA
jgi:hypothetical protein